MSDLRRAPSIWKRIRRRLASKSFAIDDSGRRVELRPDLAQAAWVPTTEATGETKASRTLNFGFLIVLFVLLYVVTPVTVVFVVGHFVARAFGVSRVLASLFVAGIIVLGFWILRRSVMPSPVVLSASTLRWLLQRGHCAGCGYDLVGGEQERGTNFECPECGANWNLEAWQKSYPIQTVDLSKEARSARVKLAREGPGLTLIDAFGTYVVVTPPIPAEESSLSEMSTSKAVPNFVATLGANRINRGECPACSQPLSTEPLHRFDGRRCDHCQAFWSTDPAALSDKVAAEKALDRFINGPI